MNPYCKLQGALLMLDFDPECSPQPRGADLRLVFKLSRLESVSLQGLVARVGSVVRVDVGLRVI